MGYAELCLYSFQHLGQREDNRPWKVSLSSRLHLHPDSTRATPHPPPDIAVPSGKLRTNHFSKQKSCSRCPTDRGAWRLERGDVQVSPQQLPAVPLWMTQAPWGLECGHNWRYDRQKDVRQKASRTKNSTQEQDTVPCFMFLSKPQAAEKEPEKVIPKRGSQASDHPGK